VTTRPSLRKLCALRAQLARVVRFSCFPDVERECRQLSGQRHPGQFLLHAALYHPEVELL
jgi:hypothetical protein